ncbi:DUF6247 family protein [Streptomyces sp. 7-21]|jgi:hypothetical protein|uniref:DUF6247 family protein n=1 Tax=Streptomyces sp. 7-21 TaxID=2802283 RepID=UPI00191E5010|nr:DUF6247 family protein [Streptomyces sp. 7-21]MBL1068566.1 prevent-host-death family protein [Streptomyces sp. 7-21]
MSISGTETVTFSDLSRSPRLVAERAARLGRVRVTHRDSDDFYLTAAEREEQREANLSTSAAVFLALLRQDDGLTSMLRAMREVFPWIRHLPDSDVRAFTTELAEALSDASELNWDGHAQEVIASWRATARIKADPMQYREALEPTEGDFGRVTLDC